MGTAGGATVHSPVMTLGMTIAVDVDLLRQHRLGLLADADEIERRACLDPPDLGALTSTTADTLARLEGRARRLAEHLRELSTPPTAGSALPTLPTARSASVSTC